MNKMKNLYLLPTEKPSRLHTWINDKGLRATLYEKPQLENPNTAKNIYITSDEKIKRGDWYIADNKLYRASVDHMPELYTYSCKKNHSNNRPRLNQ